jgi:hypothetical protein
MPCGPHGAHGWSWSNYFLFADDLQVIRPGSGVLSAVAIFWRTNLREILSHLLVAIQTNQFLFSTPRRQDVSKSLYERLGGYDAVAAVANALLDRIVQQAERNRYDGGTTQT